MKLIDRRRPSWFLLATGLQVLLLGAMLQSEALALQGGEDPALLPVLIDKRYGVAGRNQVSLQFSTPITAKYVQSTGAYLAYDRGFSDILGLELGGGYFAGSETDIMTQARSLAMAEPNFSDLYQLTWTVNADLVFVPIYGKISFASELDPSFDVLVLGGAGVAGVRRASGIGAATPTAYDSKMTAAFNAGVAFRFYLSRLLAIRIEVRDFFYPEPASGLSGLTSNLQFQGGVQFSFGGRG